MRRAGADPRRIVFVVEQGGSPVKQHRAKWTRHHGRQSISASSSRGVRACDSGNAWPSGLNSCRRVIVIARRAKLSSSDSDPTGQAYASRNARCKGLLPSDSRRSDRGVDYLRAACGGVDAREHGSRGRRQTGLSGHLRASALVSAGAGWVTRSADSARWSGSARGYVPRRRYRRTRRAAATRGSCASTADKKKGRRSPPPPSSLSIERTGGLAARPGSCRIIACRSTSTCGLGGTRCACCSATLELHGGGVPERRCDIP
jgi:hypothetical protein